MKLAASLIVRNELGRYLEPCIGHLLEFCDEVRVLDDGSEDGSVEWLLRQRGVYVAHNGGRMMFEHEGSARQTLLQATLEREPTHVLAIDADEFVADGAAVRKTLEANPEFGAWWLNMEEVWEAEVDHLCVREDGGWASHSIPALWRVPDRLDSMWRIRDRALACGRVPACVDSFAARLPYIGHLLHFGWANEQERQARYDRYVEHDGGRFHASHHLQSILAPCDRVALRAREWPAGLDAYKAQILDRANGASNVHGNIPA